MSERYHDGKTTDIKRRMTIFKNRAKSIKGCKKILKRQWRETQEYQYLYFEYIVPTCTH